MDAYVPAEIEHHTTSIDNTIEVKQDRVVKAFQAKFEILLILAGKILVIETDVLSSRRGGFGLAEVVIDPAELTAPMRKSKMTVNVCNEPHDGANPSSQH